MRDESKTGEPIGREKYQRLIAAAQRQTRIKVAVAHPCDDVSLRGAIEAFKLGLIEPILVGPAGAPWKRGQRGSPRHQWVRARRVSA